MLSNTIRLDVQKLRHKLRRLRVASWTAIEEGNCRAVARLTCEAARVEDALRLAEQSIS
jgi:hypothetical protein